MHFSQLTVVKVSNSPTIRLFVVVPIDRSQTSGLPKNAARFLVRLHFALGPIEAKTAFNTTAFDCVLQCNLVREDKQPLIFTVHLGIIRRSRN